MLNKTVVSKPQLRDEDVLSDSIDPDKTQIFSYDDVTCIPETAPFDVFVPKKGAAALVNTNTFFKANSTPFSPVSMLCSSKSMMVSPKVTTPTKSKSDSEDLDKSYYSPCILDPEPEIRAPLPSTSAARVSHQVEDEEEEDFSSYYKKKIFCKDLETKPTTIAKPIQQTPVAKKSKALKQTKLDSSIFKSDFAVDENDRRKQRDPPKARPATKKVSSPPMYLLKLNQFL